MSPGRCLTSPGRSSISSGRCLIVISLGRCLTSPGRYLISPGRCQIAPGISFISHQFVSFYFSIICSQELQFIVVSIIAGTHEKSNCYTTPSNVSTL